LDYQAKLLRVIQEREVCRVGGTRPLRLDVRIVVATNRDLLERADNGQFREDLYYRLAGYKLLLPPLRARGHDAVTIAKALLEREFSGKSLSAAARAALLRYPWPGNIRELENVVRGAAIDSGGSRISDLELKRHFCLPSSSHVITATKRAGEAVQDLLRCNERLTATAMQSALGIGKTHRHRVLAELEARGVIVQCGRGRGTYYVSLDCRPAEWPGLIFRWTRLLFAT
jgi:transcriptional regulator with GAF, ATPase, and Fis domain